MLKPWHRLVLDIIRERAFLVVQQHKESKKEIEELVRDGMCTIEALLEVIEGAYLEPVAKTETKEGLEELLRAIDADTTRNGTVLRAYLRAVLQKFK